MCAEVATMLLSRVIPNAPPASSSLPGGQALLYGEDVDLHSCLVHGQQGGVDHLVTHAVEHFRTQRVGYERHGFLFYQAGAQYGFFYLRSLRRNSVVSIHIHSERLYWINNCRHVT